MARLKHVYIYPNCTAAMAEEAINNIIDEIADTTNDIEYEMLIENSVSVGSISETRYTLLINVEDPEE